MATQPWPAQRSHTARMCALAPKISCSTTIAPRAGAGLGSVGRDTQVRSTWPSAARRSVHAIVSFSSPGGQWAARLGAPARARCIGSNSCTFSGRSRR
jgi:hypothetical protein